MLDIPKIKYLGILTKKEVKYFAVKNFDDHFKSTK